MYSLLRSGYLSNCLGNRYGTEQARASNLTA